MGWEAGLLIEGDNWTIKKWYKGIRKLIIHKYLFLWSVHKYIQKDAYRVALYIQHKYAGV